VSPQRRGWVVAALAFSIVGLLGLAVAVAAMTGSRPGNGWSGRAGSVAAAGCSAPAQPGTVVAFAARDMGMGGGMMGGGVGGALGAMGFMPRVASVPAGQVTVVLYNAGTRPHELLIMPLAAGQSAGQRRVGSDDRISETGKVGEVQQVCPTGSDVDGTVPGGISHVTVTLIPGSYEVVCNLPGHYRSGMYATLTVS
jgi:uncharacterized cupredoxin-like copper-binding protein